MTPSFPTRRSSDLRSLVGSYAKARETVETKKAHGHEVLLTYLRSHVEQIGSRPDGRKPVLIEIGSTRENVAGQGSTRIIADFCQSSNIDFITVDMDPHNTAAAGAMFKKLGVGFQAVNDKGEDFLRAYADDMDFVFLDAYDFDQIGRAHV